MDYLINIVFLPWWFSLPGYVANQCPGMARALPGGKIPVSLRYLGPNKTLAAIPATLTGAAVTAFLQSLIVYPTSYPRVSWWIIAICFGIGTVFGDWAKSFAKRMRGIRPGEKWWVEKIDFLVMSLLFLTIACGLFPLPYYLVPVGFFLLVHSPVNRLSYKLGWRNSPH